LPPIAYPPIKDLPPYPKALREAIGSGGQDIMARSRLAAGRDSGAQGQTADTLGPCRRGRDASFGAGDVGLVGLFEVISARLQEGKFGLSLSSGNLYGQQARRAIHLSRGSTPHGPRTY